MGEIPRDSGGGWKSVSCFYRCFEYSSHHFYHCFEYSLHHFYHCFERWIIHRISILNIAILIVIMLTKGGEKWFKSKLVIMIKMLTFLVMIAFLTLVAFCSYSWLWDIIDCLLGKRDQTLSILLCILIFWAFDLPNPGIFRDQRSFTTRLTTDLFFGGNVDFETPAFPEQVVLSPFVACQLFPPPKKEDFIWTLTCLWIFATSEKF